MKQQLVSGIDGLIKGGASFIAIPCNTVYNYFDYMQENFSVPLLNMIDLVAGQVQQQAEKISLLATQQTVKFQLYQRQLEKYGKEFFHSDVIQENVNDLIVCLKEFGYNDNAKQLWLNILSNLEAESVEAVIIGCSDLVICQTNIVKNLMFIDSAEILAKSTVEYYCEIGSM